MTTHRLMWTEYKRRPKPLAYGDEAPVEGISMYAELPRKKDEPERFYEIEAYENGESFVTFFVGDGEAAESNSPTEGDKYDYPFTLHQAFMQAQNHADTGQWLPVDEGQ